MPASIGGEGMAKAAPAPQRRPRSWVGPLVVGVCFGLGYGLSQRLFNLQVGELVRFGRNFDVQPFPGSSLESLRLRFGSSSEPLQADLDALEQERLRVEEAAQAAAEAKEAAASPDGGLVPGEPAAAGVCVRSEMGSDDRQEIHMDDTRAEGGAAFLES